MISSMIALWVTLTIITGVVAANKGRDVIGWLALAVFVAPLALLILLSLPKNQTQIDQRQMKSGGMAKCPCCAEMVKAEAIRCKHCAADISRDSGLMQIFEQYRKDVA